jgi:hypothetical protein
MNLFSHRISTPSCYNGGISPRWDRSEEDDKLKAPIPVRIQGPSIIGLRTFCSYGCCFVSSSALRFLCSALPAKCKCLGSPSAICTAICSEYTEGQEAGVRRSKLALCWRCLGSVRGLYCCVGRAVFLFKVCSNCSSSSSSSATSRQLLQGEILCEIFLPFNWLIVDINCSGISKKLFSSIRIL